MVLDKLHWNMAAFKMRWTKHGVDNGRMGLDALNRILRSSNKQFTRIKEACAADAPWANVTIISVCCTFIPILGYPYAAQYITPDPRRIAEEERVRLCLQKGIDPYPYLQHREHQWGNGYPLLVTDEVQVPGSVGEHSRIMERYRVRQREDFRDFEKSEAEARTVEQKEYTWAERMLFYRDDGSIQAAQKMAAEKRAHLIP